MPRAPVQANPAYTVPTPKLSLSFLLMRSTTRILRQISHPRAKSVSFVGLGRMGSEMAYNIFSKRFAEASDFHFAVCDAIPEAATQFAENIRMQFSGAHITVAANPEE
jgi:3-hydroxyisobutyrate dehydrogenase